MARTNPIFIIDDDADDQQFYQQAIRELGYTNPVKIFEDAQSTIDYLSSATEQPFLILCDLNLPGKNGIQLRKMITENAFLRKKSIPFVFIATSDSQEDVNEAYELTIQGYFKKPTSYEELKKLVDQVIRYRMNCRHPNNLEQS